MQRHRSLEGPRRRRQPSLSVVSAAPIGAKLFRSRIKNLDHRLPPASFHGGQRRPGHPGRRSFAQDLIIEYKQQGSIASVKQNSAELSGLRTPPLARVQLLLMTFSKQAQIRDHEDKWPEQLIENMVRLCRHLFPPRQQRALNCHRKSPTHTHTPPGAASPFGNLKNGIVCQDSTTRSAAPLCIAIS